MSQNREIAQGFVKDKKEDVTAFWKKLFEELNSVGPPVKNITKWKKVEYLRMDSSSAASEPLFDTPIVRKPSTSFIMIGVCNRNSIGRMHPGPTLFSVNGSDLNAGTSLSDDSGLTLTTNSSISSGDSIQLDMCKYEVDIIGSDEDASFQSFDHCSVGGMSTENFNTLKRGPFTPIDPPLEFQDSPKSTIIRSAENNASKTMNRWPLSTAYFEDPEEISDKLISKHKLIYDSKHIKGSYSINKHLHSSDSFLNAHTDNIYDEPNNIISTSLENCIDVCESKSSSTFTALVPNIGSHSICSLDNEKNKCQQGFLSSQEHISNNLQILNCNETLSKHKYDFNGETKNKKTLQHRYSPKNRIFKNQPYNSYQYNALHYASGSCSCGNRAHSRNSLNSRLSSSHNSLCIHTTNKADDSIFITQAMSHDALLSREISDFYNVPIDSDIYAFPIDMVTSRNECLHDDNGVLSSAKKINIFVQSNDTLVHRLMKYNEKDTVCKSYRVKDGKQVHDGIHKNNVKSKKVKYQSQIKHKSTKQSNENIEQHSHEPLQTTLEEVKQFYQTLYSDTSGKTKHLRYVKNGAAISPKEHRSNVNNTKLHSATDETTTNNLSSYKKADEETTIIYNNDVAISGHNNVQYQVPNIKNSVNTSKGIQSQQISQGKSQNQIHTTITKQTLQADKKSQFNLNLKQKLCSIFRFRKSGSRCVNSSASDEYISNSDHTSLQIHAEDKKNKFQSRALPPLPKLEPRRMLSCGYIEQRPELQTYHFTSSIEKVKDYGWYWGPLSSEAAENILSNEPDGSFIVRDSSDDHYIFSLSFKLNSCVRHVRIEQDQGTFSFGSYAKFKSQTITEFIEKAVDHSRSGRYLFFLHRRPEHGPMRVQLTNPVSRFKHVQSLQHICRFVILKAVIRKDLIQTLPLPRRLLDYVNYKHCYSEQVESDCSHSQITGDSSNNNT